MNPLITLHSFNCSSFLLYNKKKYPAVPVPGLRLRWFPCPHRRALARCARQPSRVPVSTLPLQFGMGSMHPDAPGPPAQRTEPRQLAVARERRAGGGDQIPFSFEESRREQRRITVTWQRNRRRRQTIFLSLLSVCHRSEGSLYPT